MRAAGPHRARLTDAPMEPPLRIRDRPGRNRVPVLSIAGAEGESHILFIIDDSRGRMNGPGAGHRAI